MASVEVSNVRKSFGSLEVIHGVSIGVEDGEFVILSGRRDAASRRFCA